MPVFKKKNSSLYVLTNYKVMYSTLRYQKSLQRINISKISKREILLNKFFLNHLQFYFIVRNPYNKVESFFKEKFRKSLNYYDENGFWQDSQKLFFPFLNIEDSMSPDLIKEKLRKTSFSDMIAIMPKVSMLDGHLQPQWLKFSIKFRIWRFVFNMSIKPKKIFKIESQEDLKEFSKIFNINIASRVNDTSIINEKLIWTKKNISIVEELYKVDFDLFNYKKK